MPDIQDAFTTALLDANKPVPRGIVNPDGTPATKRFDVYRNNVVQSLMEALGTAFPVVKKLVGEDFFNAVAGVYVRQNPPTSPLIMFYGESFPAFLSGFPPAQQIPYLPDVARLEQARRVVYHAADDPMLAPDALGTIAPEALMTITITLHSACQIVRSEHPILGIWRANMKAGAPQPIPQPEDVLVARPNNTVTLTLLGPGEAEFLHALTSMQLGPAAEDAASRNAAFDLSSALGKILATGLLSAITTEE